MKKRKDKPQMAIDNKLCLAKSLTSSIFVPAVLLLSNPLTATAQGNIPQQEHSTSNRDGKHYVSGIVLDENGEPIPGAMIAIKESNRRGITDTDGHFDLWLDANEKTLVVSFFSMETQEINTFSKSPLRIEMKPAENVLSDVVVTGYQTISKERATGAFDVLTPKDLKGKLQPDIISRLEGKAAGMVEHNGSFFVRGIATLRGGAEGYKPLIVVDGLPFEGELESINPAIIKNITVLKDAAAASIYGARAANGVIVITTLDGSENRRTIVKYDGSMKFTPKPDLSSLNLMRSSELVALQQYGFQFQRGTYSSLNPRQAVNPVLELLYKNKDGLISDDELSAGLARYSSLDNRSQLEHFYARTGIEHQHNLSITGGNDNNRYALSLNYIGNNPNLRYQSIRRYGFTLRDNIKFFNWLKADVGVTSSFMRDSGDSGMGSYKDFYTSNPSYYMLQDESGNALDILRNKSAYELQRLQSIGLYDEAYSPITNRQKQYYKNRENYYRVQAGLNFRFTDYLNLDIKFQTENSDMKNETTFSRNSYYVRNMINNAAQYDSATGELTLNVPEGGQFSQVRGDTHSYTLRAQLNFDKEFGKNYVTAIAGAERRRVKTTNTANYYMGYDTNSLGFKPVNPLILASLNGTESIGGSFTWTYTDHNYLYELENRYVSFYANASYTYENKYDVTGSIRIDKSNLFGTDPKYQNRPLWSLGTSWHANKEDFLQDVKWLNNLTFRLTYGIGGNVPKNAGPYLTLYAPKYNYFLEDFGSEIKNPPNPTLRWEKTSTFNLGIDFSVLNNRLSGSLDIYNKNTKDLLANRNADPTLGWEQVMLNYGKMYNRGLELSLNSRNIETKDFRWTTALTFSYNKNKLTDVEDANANVFDYTNGDAAVKGYPLGAVFSYRYAGLSSKDGTPLYYINDGKATDTNVGSITDLEFSGTNIPKYAGSLSNTFSYKNFDLSFMFIYYGGHVLRSEAARYLSLAPTTNVNRETLNMWKQPGDELRKDVTPAITGSTLDSEYDLHPWYAANIHVIKGDYIKLRDLSLTYNFDQPLISKMGLSALSVTVQAENLLTWHANHKGIDPEAMTTTGYGWGARTVAVPQTWTIGISATF